jgi:hypothetical protein
VISPNRCSDPGERWGVSPPVRGIYKLRSEYRQANASRSPVLEYRQANASRSPVLEYRQANASRSPVLEYRQAYASRSPVLEYRQAYASRSPVLEYRQANASRSPVLEYRQAYASRSPVLAPRENVRRLQYRITLRMIHSPAIARITLPNHTEYGGNSPALARSTPNASSG